MISDHQTPTHPNPMTAQDLVPDLQAIGYDLADIPSHRIEPGRILISIADSITGEADWTITTLRRHLPKGATADWTNDSNTDGDGETTSDCAITWTPHPHVRA